MEPFSGPLAVISNIFETPISTVVVNLDARNCYSDTSENDPLMRSCSISGSLLSIVKELDDIENFHRTKLGLPAIQEMPAMALEKVNRLALQDALWADSNWKMSAMRAIFGSGLDTGVYRELMSPFPVVYDLEHPIYLPDWNALTARLLNLNQNGGALSLDVGIAHSYVTQLNRRGKIPDGQFYPLSVYGVVLTQDGEVMLGTRAGMNLAGGHMTVPAGSFYLTIENGKPTAHPFAAIHKEIRDETGLAPDDYTIPGVIGTFVERASHNTTGIVYLVQTNKTTAELQKIWETQGNKEHSDIFFIAPDNLGKYIESHAERRRKIMSDADAAHPLLPSGVAVLLTYLGQSRPSEFANTRTALEGLYQ